MCVSVRIFTSACVQVYIDGFSIRNCMAKDGGAFVFRYVRSPRVGRVDEIGADASSCTGMQDDGDVLKFGGERCFLLRYTVC
jgi:hypothetical protein